MPRYGRLPTMEEVLDLAQELMETPEYQDREVHFDEYDNAAQLEWAPPSLDDEDPESVFDVSTSNPYDALNGAAAVLAANRPIITFQPLDPSLETRQRAESIEDALHVILARGGKRNRSSIEMDVAMSALRYHEGIVQVVPLKHMENVLGYNPDHTRGRGGPFIFNILNPRDVFVSYDAYGLSYVVTRSRRRAHEVRAFWGKKGEDALAPLLDSPDKKIRKAFQEVYVWEYWDYEVQAVWVAPAGELTAVAAKTTGDRGRVPIMKPTKHNLPFLPFAYGMGGSELDRAGDGRRPLLYAIIKTGSWDAANLFETIAATKIIQNAKRPMTEYTGMNAQEGVEEDATLAGGGRYLAPGVTGRDLPPPSMDTAFVEYSNRMTDRMSASSLPQVLANGTVPSGSVFSTLNLAVKTALTTLVPYKQLSERIYEQVCELVLLWLAHLKMDYTVYAQGTRAGEVFTLEWDTIPTEELDIKVTMDQQEPTDFQQKVNAAAIMLNTLGASRTTAMQMAGVANPARELERAFIDAVDQAIQAGEITGIQQAYLMKIQMAQQEMMAQMQQQNQAAQAQQQMMAQAQAGVQGPGQFGPGMPPGAPPEAQPFNPAAGGQPPVQAGAPPGVGQGIPDTGGLA